MNGMRTGIALVLLAAFLVSGCSQPPKSANSNAAIQQAASLQTVEEKVNFLVSEANAFLNSKQFDDAVNTAKYVLNRLDSNSQEAKSILEQAKTKLEAMAKEEAQKMKTGLTDVMGTVGK